MLVDGKAMAYAMLQSHNQKVVTNDRGVFITYARTADANYTNQRWGLPVARIG